MKQTNNHEDIIRYGDPLMGGGRLRNRGYPAINYNDRSPEVAAMDAHLRASAYGDEENVKAPKSTPRRTVSDALSRNRPRSFLHLGRRYDTQARENFMREAVLFALIVTLAIWSIIHAVQAARG